MTSTPYTDTAPAEHSGFQAAMVDGGTEPAVAAELERRIRVIEHDEAQDESRRPMSGRELAVYVAVSVVVVVLGLLVVIL
ncbi:MULTISPECIES: hypothetical protein [unclassified Microcella]|uniref:hypothetical protein n=1 Tax=unclassified Microcella TaxID=2630066 RepID=UPI0006F74EBB|nr:MULTISPECIES: hypothetical protein [unclassified Microcella]KQV26457.1 hypothetical protein ASC54_06150 [Yonghaparkia sp. Root332]KRF32761.1 hypothetical protein ASG83_01575 [Yonghaparkia sp. Soil809]